MLICSVFSHSQILTSWDIPGKVLLNISDCKRDITIHSFDLGHDFMSHNLKKLGEQTNL